MALRDSQGTCLLCKSKYRGAGMTRHLQLCIPKSLQKQQKSKSQAFYHILVRGYYLSGYWLHLKVAANATLKDLDTFLRRIWLECCGHMSAFSYNRRELDMRQKLKDVLSPRMELLYEYDFGSTTELLIKVIGQYKGSMEKNVRVQVIARNAPPEILCDECRKVPAVRICTECQWDDTGWLCQACAEDHECGIDMMLPVLNSPRVGVCGYMGEG